MYDVNVLPVLPLLSYLLGCTAAHGSAESGPGDSGGDSRGDSQVDSGVSSDSGFRVTRPARSRPDVHPSGALAVTNGTDADLYRVWLYDPVSGLSSFKAKDSGSGPQPLIPVGEVLTWAGLHIGPWRAAVTTVDGRCASENLTISAGVVTAWTVTTLPGTFSDASQTCIVP